jgi:Na+/H+ antiporter NhaD/arsenite permease-like protein
MSEKPVVFILRISRLVKEVIVWFASLLAYGLLAAGFGDGPKPEYALQFSVFVFAVVTIFLLACLTPRFLRRRWPKVVEAFQKKTPTNSRSIFWRVGVVLLVIALVGGLSMLLVIRSW